MNTLIAFATFWGTKHGGINSFNVDLLSAIGSAYYIGVKVICVVSAAKPEEIEAARNRHNVRLIPLPYEPKGSTFATAVGEAGVTELKRKNVDFDPDRTVWLGHDRITGAAAIAAAKQAGGRSALIHHMSYAHYESFAENSVTASQKEQDQRTLFRQADIVFGVGPLLRDALCDLLARPDGVPMLIPGLAEIDLHDAPKTFTAFLSGRLSDDAARIKQSHLGIAAFAQAHGDACVDMGLPDALRNAPRLRLRGVDFEPRICRTGSDELEDPEIELKKFAESYADRVINLHALPFTQDRQQLNEELSGSTVALMPSWHEGFGLTGWEAIAAGVPLIISRNSGVYRFIDERLPGTGTGCVYDVDIKGLVAEPYFHNSDLTAVAVHLKGIARNPQRARRKASSLRSNLENYTWAGCAKQLVTALDWDMQQGVISSPSPDPNTYASQRADVPDDFLIIPTAIWQQGCGLADSQLLRAEEGVVPFDAARQPDLDVLQDWLDNSEFLQATRLITGAGGLGKTRLALELCYRSIDRGWHAGFFDSSILPAQVAGAWKLLVAHQKPVLIVLDYAETRQAKLLALAKALLNTPSSKPVRILLMARNAGEWWDSLLGRDAQCEAFLNGLATSGPFLLPSLYTKQADRIARVVKKLIRIEISTP